MKRTLVCCVCVLAAIVLKAQNKNLNPTVSVTNDYAGKVIDADREAMKIEVPDSLYEFNLAFDYVGFEKQYKGNDEFNPYYTELLMEQRPLNYRKFYMKAGAGYSVHPVFDLAWSINPEGKCRVGLYASHKSYFGDYDKCFYDQGLVENERRFNGYDSKSAAGVNARIDWEKLFLSMNVSYDGVHSLERFYGNDGNKSGYNAVSASLRLKSASPEGVSKWKYDVTARYSYGMDAPGTSNTVFGTVREQNAAFDADVSAVFGYSAIELLSSGDFVFGKDASYYNAHSVSLKPRYVFSGGNISLGIGLCLLFNGGYNVIGTENSKKENERFAAWPSIRFRWSLIPGKLECFADADMSSKLFGTRSKAMKYHFNLYEKNRYMVKSSNADFGFGGDIAERVKWKLTAAYERIQNADVPVVALADGNVCFPALSLLHEKSLEDFNFSFDMKSRFGGFYLDGTVRYALYLYKAETPVMPSPLTANAEMGYDFLKKATVFVGADYKSSYSVNGGEYYGMTVNAFQVNDLVNLYAGARLSVSRHAAIFVEGGNLLNRQCQYIPGIAERGFSIIGGLTLNF